MSVGLGNGRGSGIRGGEEGGGKYAVIEEGAYQHVLPGEASVDERGDVPEDSSSASVGLFRG